MGFLVAKREKDNGTSLKGVRTSRELTILNQLVLNRYK
ncbi:Uncharacterised protein [Zhongshania aliphaticivorans]|uniref:Uncharacterized protein n=1 Tax=Zhongshania aliphaticivorans TaxID=1470434 RepID=A0A5S9QPI6_9GAMM|nr:Uncharacterised protein [Zhongshania aliphaticivorans]CAA0115351.1 Uncharacterised protein [Zhongshania aliphaticivorans]CAA0120170.1 Uncharacterised protein [Zhongshania aliphaticivorans]